LGIPYGLTSILAKHDPLEERFVSISKSHLNDLNKIYWLIEDCKRYGTLPFAGVARAAFIATAMMNSIVRLGVISEDDLKNFYESINSTATRILPDVKNLTKANFVEKYGHLRPGTFDITTPNYANAFELYFPSSTGSDKASQNQREDLRQKIILLVDESGVLSELDIDGEQLVSFAETAIASREEVKFNFSKHISLVLELIAKIGARVGFNREQMSNVNVQIFMNAYKESLSIEHEIRKQILDGSISAAYSKAIWLPPIICSPEDVIAFEIPKLLPNFVTNKSISAEVLNLKSPSENLEGKIILIESADPGFDWIFTRKISGIITCYGGANSHMAVRAKEIDIPAAIGVGEEMFGIYGKSAFIQLDCTKKLIEVIR
jgi:phosphohistidine swiveling domain-containing protein